MATDLSDLVRSLVENPLQGSAVISTVGAVSLCSYWLKRHDDGKLVSFATKVTTALLTVVSVGLICTLVLHTKRSTLSDEVRNSTVSAAPDVSATAIAVPANVKAAVKPAIPSSSAQERRVVPPSADEPKPAPAEFLFVEGRWRTGATSCKYPSIISLEKERLVIRLPNGEIFASFRIVDQDASKVRTENNGLVEIYRRAGAELQIERDHKTTRLFRCY